MKNLLFTLLCICSFQVGYGQGYDALVSEAWQQYEEGSYEASMNTYLEAFKIKKDNPRDLYDGACSASLAGEEKTALKLLKAAHKAGYINARHMSKDSDLANLHGLKKWDKILAKVQADLDAREAGYNKPLQKELLTIYEDDQAIRRELMAAAEVHGWDTPATDSLIQLMVIQDSINHEKVINILDKHGWVGPDEVGGQASQALFLVIQHADIETQQKYLPVMRKAVEEGKAQARSLALLEDRVALREGRKQIYGSQIGRNPETNEQYVMPLVDPDNVDKRRAEVGLGPLSEYASRFGLEWDVEDYKKRLPEYEAWQEKY